MDLGGFCGGFLIFFFFSRGMKENKEHVFRCSLTDNKIKK